MADFLKKIINLIGWALIIISFGIYVRFQEYLTNVPKIITVLGMIIVLSMGIIMILYRSYKRLSEAEEIGGEIPDRVIHITPMDEFKHDILALLTAVIIIGLVFFKQGVFIDGTDLIQAGIAFLGVMLVRFIYRI